MRRARSSRATASRWRPRRCSTPAQNAITGTRAGCPAGRRSRTSQSVSRPPRAGRRRRAPSPSRSAARCAGPPCSRRRAAAATRPCTSARRAPGHGRRSSRRLGEQRHGLDVADGCRALDVRSARRGARAALGEHRGDTRVSAGAPADRGQLVDGRAHDRVAKGELPVASRSVGRAGTAAARRSGRARRPRRRRRRPPPAAPRTDRRSRRRRAAGPATAPTATTARSPAPLAPSRGLSRPDRRPAGGRRS